MQKYAGQPFALLGVSADASRDALRQLQQKHSPPWASWWDGPSGPVAAAWGVDAFPTSFLIDAQGVVRFRHVGVLDPEAVEREIDTLLREAQVR